MAKKLVLIDGTALAYRAYFAFIRRPLMNSKGENTSAPFGFLNSLMRIKREYNPDYLVVSFDLGAPTKRHEIYPEYKSTRAKMPDEMVDSLPRLDQITDAMNVPVVTIEGVEADDIIGTIAKKGEAEGFDVYIYTGDKDFFQLVNDNISIILPGKGGEPDKILDSAGVAEKFGVTPEKVVDVLGLMGDSSDNIPGVPGVGPKTAIQLVDEYGGFENLYDSLDSLTKKKVRENLKKSREQAELSRRLVTIDTDIALDFNWDECKIADPDLDKLVPLLKELEFDKLTAEFVSETEENSNAPEIKYEQIKSIDELKSLSQRIIEKGYFAFDTETTSLRSRDAELVGLSLSVEEQEAFYVPLAHEGSDENLPFDEVLEIAREIFGNKTVLKIAQNLKYDLQVLRNCEVDIEGKTFDTMLAAYLLDPSARQYGLSALSLKHFNYTMQEISELIGSGNSQKSFGKVPVSQAVFYACEDVDITFRLYNLFAPNLAENKLERLFYEIEMPLVEVLRYMEEVGVKVNSDKLKEISGNLDNSMERLKERIYEESGYEFNINSPVQLRKVLFEDLQLPSKGKTAKKTGFSTDASVLEELARIHPLPKMILEFRELTKIKSTYSDALVELIDPQTSRIHTSFNQAVTATGRLSSADPNLQNIPVRTELGREVREAFV
ncbi:MAG: DNA polymerase I, partial [candidate division Zixibacteria bacterium]|nr:DNA polymerase I [candidate division Zixibacteria bacterium]